MKKIGKYVSALATGALLITLASCGSDDGATESADSSVAAATGTKCTEPLNIGVAAITMQSPAVTSMINTINRAAEILGWNVEVLDANGDPSKMEADISGFVNKGVDAILDIAEAPAQAPLGMQAAREKNIPIFNIGGPLVDPDGYFAATYAPDDEKMSILLAEQMVKDLESMGGKGVALSLDASGIPALAIRTEVLARETAGKGITVKVNHETDMTNPVEDTIKAVSNYLQANPDINVIFATQDFEFVSSINAVASQGLQKTAVYSYYPVADAFQVMRDWKEGDAPIAAVDQPITNVGWYAFDSLVNRCVGVENWVTDMSLKELPTTLVTPANVPADDVLPYEDFEPFFVERWTAAGQL